MARLSKRKMCIKKLEERVIKLKKLCIASLGDDDVLQPDNYLCVLCLVAHRNLKHVTSKPCLFRSRKCRKNKGECPYDKDFFDSEDLPWLNEAEFLQTYRMSRKNMRKLIDMCKDHPLFEVLNRNKTVNKEKTEKRARNHFMHLLYFLGTFGEGGNNSNSRNKYKQGYGTYENMRKTCVKVILDCMKKEYLYWPNENERNGISQQIWNKYGWVNCVGYLDGTLLPLYYKPQSEDCGDYYGRKLGYTMPALVVSDENLLVRHTQVGWPGCTHDDRVLAHSKLWKDSKKIQMFRVFACGLCFLCGR